MSRTRFRPTLYQHRFSMMECLFALLICVLSVGTSIPAVAAHRAAFGGTDSRTAPGLSSSRNAKTPRLAFVSPTFGATETGSIVTVELALSHDAERSTVKVKLNGHDISTSLHYGSCKRETCTMIGTVTVQQGLENGQNLLSASVNGVGRGPGDVRRTRFLYQEEPGGGTPSAYAVKYYDPASVGISTLMPGEGSAWIEITTGSTMGIKDPVATFPVETNVGSSVSIPYQDMQFSTSCAATFSLQALALKRNRPSDLEAVACGNSVAEVETSLNNTLGQDKDKPHSLGDTDLVILGTTSGNIAPSGLTELNTTDFGGTDYSSVPSTLYPQQYMIIGVKGAAAGTAHESYNVVATSHQSPVFNGTLMVDGNSNYNYVPSGDQLFSVVSGVDTSSTGITVGSYSYQPPPITGGGGAFWLLVLDRQTLQPVTYAVTASNGEQWVSCQNKTGNPQQCGGIYPAASNENVLTDLAGTLGNISPRNLVFLVASGCPVQSASQLPPAIGAEIQSLGGVAYSLQNMATGSKTCAYSLISVNDGNHMDVLTGHAALSANQYSAQAQIGALQGFLALNKSGLYDVAGKAQVAGRDKNGNPITSVNFTYEQIASSQRADWPLTSTPSLLAAYHDISYQLLSNANVAETGSNEYDIRYFYTGDKAPALIAEGSTVSMMTPSNWDTATNAADFKTAQNQITTELADLNSAGLYLGDGGIRGALINSDLPILTNMFSVATAISADAANAGNQSVDGSLSNGMNLAAGVVSIAAAVAGLAFPPAGAALGIMSGALWAGSAAASFDGGSSIPGPENYFDITLSGLAQDASTDSNLTLAGFDGTVDNIYTDWTKLKTVSGYTSASGSAWNIKDPTTLDNLNTILVAGATRSLWLDVLPKLYGTRLFFDKDHKNPSDYTYDYYDATGKYVCDSVYSDVPAASTKAYPDFADPSHFNVVILAEGTTLVNNYHGSVMDTPISSKLAQLLTTPGMITIGGNPQPGLNITPDILFNNGPLLAIPGAQYSMDFCDAGSSGAQEASFTITPAPGAETIRRGDIGAFVLQLKSVNGFKGNVMLTCSGGPPNSQCGDLPQTVKVNGTAYALSGVRFPQKTPPGTYTINFTGVSGAVTNSATANFTVK